MLTPQEAQAGLRHNQAFVNQCTAYRALLKEHDLSVSVNLDNLVKDIRNQEFAKVLAVDPGLKVRFDLLRTEEAQQQLIAQTINLDGYDVVDDLQRTVRQLTASYRNVMIQVGNGFFVPHKEVSLSQLAGSYGLDLARLLKDRTMCWDGEEHVLAFFQELAQTLTKWREFIRQTRQAGATLDGALSRLGQYYTEGSQTGTIEPNLHFLHQELPNLKACGLLKPATT